MQKFIYIVSCVCKAAWLFGAGFDLDFAMLGPLLLCSSRAQLIFATSCSSLSDDRPKQLRETQDWNEEDATKFCRSFCRIPLLDLLSPNASFDPVRNAVLVVSGCLPPKRAGDYSGRSGVGFDLH